MQNGNEFTHHRQEKLSCDCIEEKSVGSKFSLHGRRD